MSTRLDFSPAPGAAPATRRVISHGLTETRLMVRNGEQLLLALIIPIAILVAARFLESSLLGDQLPASVLALAVWSTAFTSVAIATGFERRYGVLERLAATPLGRTGLITGKAMAVVIIVIGQLLILTVVAVLLGWRPQFSAISTLLAIAAVILAIVGFVGFALILAGRLRAEATLALANVIYVILLVAGGLVVPAARFPAPLETIIGLLPTGALGNELRSASAGVVDGWPLLVLAVWAIILTFAARKAFRWIS
ncbi:ABC transporter permease [Microlunatus elymi]|uniref:ABC transporter permease n=1 Tax=Microlunatus elymi TaxID=2596828 RepID=A0A516Q281_9ACTN|nr:ABC transporter permease [Microlunatus elymi]QDP97508.1 ABC transporter permease [Microlunatus elymi]